MLKKLISLSAVGLLALVGCGGDAVTQTFVANTTNVPDNDEETAAFGVDFNGDAVVDDDDNSLADLAAQVGALAIDLEGLLNTAVADGTVLIAVDVTAVDFANDDKATANAYLANTADGGVPVFDGTQALVVGGNGEEFLFNGVTIVNGNLNTEASDFVFALPLDPANPTLLTLSNAVLKGTINAEAATIANGSLSGTVDVLEFAAALGSVGTLVDGLVATAGAEFSGAEPVACDGAAGGASADCDAIAAGGACTDANADGTATGFCVAADNAVLTVLGFIDGNANGIVEVEFDGTDFVENELSILFDFNDENGAPQGLIGGLFRLDLNADTINDAMGLGIGFSAVGAVRQ